MCNVKGIIRIDKPRDDNHMIWQSPSDLLFWFYVLQLHWSGSL